MIQENQHLQPGTVLAGGRYRIKRFIGAGGFGCTYEAEFVPMGSRVAIKEFFVSSCCNREASGAVSVGIPSQSALVGKLEEKFVREAKRLFNMQHTNIVRVSDIIQENGTSYYVMDYISGLSLQAVINHDGPLPETRALWYIGQVMDALEYVHSKNMLHLDIKPDNIMIDTETDRAILIDFGVSKQYDEADGHNTSTIMGQTPGYAPPEQAGNSIRQFTPAADIYALGATLYTALTGMAPPSSNDLISGFARLAPLPAGTSAATHQAIGRMMQPRADQRPQSVAAARALLGMENGKLKIENEAPVPPVTTDPSATSPLTPDRETKPIPSKPKSKKWLWATIAAAAIAIGAIAYFLIPSGGKAADPAAQTDTLAAAADTTLAVGMVEEDDAAAEEDETPSPLPAPQTDQQAGQQQSAAAVIVEQQQSAPAANASANVQPTVEPAPTPAPVVQSSSLRGSENGHEWLDMGTSVRWATTNVGSSTPKGKGNFYAWGETSPKSEYTEENSITYGKTFGSIAGDSRYDAARANWGGKWRMPTKAEFQELIDKCTWTWYGSGYEVKSKTTGNVIYLPAAGWQYGSSLDRAGEYGYFWSATPNGSEGAWYLYFYSDGKGVYYGSRDGGHSVRPVLE